MKDIIEFIGSEIKKAVQHLKPYIIKYDIEIDKINPNVEKNKNVSYMIKSYRYTYIYFILKIYIFFISFFH